MTDLESLEGEFSIGGGCINLRGGVTVRGMAATLADAGLKRSSLREAILLVLDEAGGVIRSESGQATALLRGRIPEGCRKPRSSSGPDKPFLGALAGLDAAGVIRRETRGKRTYAIELADRFRTTLEAASEPEPVVEAPQPEPVALSLVPDVSTPGFDYHALADSMLVRVAEILGSDPVDQSSVIQQLRGELILAQTSKKHLERRVRAAEDELVAVTRRRDVLMSQVMTLEANIDAMLKGHRNGDAEAAFKALDRFMRERPQLGAHA